MINTKEYLKQLDVCTEGFKWVGDKTAAQAWEECQRGDWMLWMAQKQGVDIKLLTLAKVKCARLVQHLMKDERSLKALDVAEKFANGQATREELDAAACAADDYAAAAAADAAHVAADAVYAVAAAAAAYAAADAADDAYAAADAVYAVAVRRQTLKQCANIVRETISFNSLNLGDIK